MNTGCVCVMQEIEEGSGGSAGFWKHVEAGLREQAERLRSDLALSRQESRELQERLMVSEATVHAQADQLKEYRELLSAYKHTEVCTVITNAMPTPKPNFNPKPK